MQGPWQPMLTLFERSAAEYRRMQGYPNAPPSLPSWRLGHKQRQRMDARVTLKVTRPCGHGAYLQEHIWAAPTSVAKMRQGALPCPHPHAFLARCATVRTLRRQGCARVACLARILGGAPKVRDALQTGGQVEQGRPAWPAF